MPVSDAAAGTWIEGTYQGHDVDEFGLGEPDSAGKAEEIAVCEQRKVVPDETDGFGSHRRVRGQLVELEQKALAQIAGGHARRIERLHEFDHGFHLIDRVGDVHGVDKLGRRRGEHAVVVDVPDDHVGRRPVPFRQRREVQLPKQVIEERILRAVAILETVVLFGSGSGCRARGLVDVVPGDVHGQILGDLFDGPGRLGGVGLERHVCAVRVSGVARHRTISGAVRRIGIVAVGVERVLGVGRGWNLLGFLDEIQHGVRLDRLANLGLEFQGGELHQPDCLLQLRRHRQVLAHAQGKRLFHHSSNISPR